MMLVVADDGGEFGNDMDASWAIDCRESTQRIRLNHD